MTATSAASGPVIILLENYPFDRQESMLRFGQLLRTSLEADGLTVEPVSPRVVLGPLGGKGAVSKWLGYLDKYLIFPVELLGHFSRLREKYLGRKIIVHICDHSNAVYTLLMRRWFPVVVTCHDLLAVRGALGEDTDCPASGYGKYLQKAILSGLKASTEVVCVSRATQADLIRLVGTQATAHSEVIPLGLNYGYRPLPQDEAMAALKHAGIDLEYQRYVLHVGSGHRRKNRAASLYAVAKIRETWPGRIAFAGEPLSAAERELTRSLGIGERVREISGADNVTLNALYAAATALVFMSRAEGFGWPILEAQAAGCPVIVSNRTSVPEVAGEGALVHEPEDYDAVAADIVRVQEHAFRENAVAQGLKNAAGYSNARMIAQYEDLYARVK